MRDLDLVELWRDGGGNGEIERDLLLAHFAGAFAYLLNAGPASCRPLRGNVPAAACSIEACAANVPRAS